MNVRRCSVWGAIFLGFIQLSVYSSARASVAKPDEVIAPHVHALLPGGRVTVVAQVLNGGCLVSLSNTDKIVQLGDVRSNQFSGVGSDAAAVPFSIQLDGCSSNVSESVAVAFTGVVDTQDLQVLAVTPGPGAAEGVGVAIFDERNQLQPINIPPAHFVSLNNGVNTLRFSAKYRMTQLFITPGAVNAYADFTLIYQ